MATHSSILAWRIPRIKEPGGLQSKESQRVGHNWVQHSIATIRKACIQKMFKKRKTRKGQPNRETSRRNFTKEDKQMANKHIKRCTTLLVSREVKIKLRYCYMSIRMKEMKMGKKIHSAKYWQACETMQALVDCWWGWTLVQLYFKTAWLSL